MDKTEAFRLAVAEVGTRPSEWLSSFIEQQYGVKIEPRHIPLFRASLEDRERTNQARPAAREVMAPGRAGLVLPRGSQRLLEVRNVALGLLVRHGLPNWSFAYNRRKLTLGLCVYHRQTIELSVHFVERNSAEEILDTILHEIAHALVGPGHGHDAIWKRQCVAVGARPERQGEADMPLGRWRARCRSCGKHFHRYRRPRWRTGWFCGDCGRERGSLAWKYS